MSKLEQLIEELCPDGVEYKSLSEIADVSGAGVDKKTIANEKSIILLNYMDVYRNRYLTIDIPKMKVSTSDTKIQQCNVQYGDIYITPSSETKDDILRSSVVIEDMEGVVYSYHIMRIRLNEINLTTSCYLSYLFQNEVFRKTIYKLVNGNTRMTITKTNIENIQIPIPPIDVQREIVRILDNFTELTAEL